MGKMKRVRQKLHAAAVKSRIKSSNRTDDDVLMDASVVVPTDPTAEGLRGDSLFKNVRISSVELSSQKLPDFDAVSTITSRTFKGQNLKKKDKHKIRHNAWIAKIDMIQSSEKAARESKRKQKTPIVGDLTPFEDALPTLELLMRESTESSRRNSKTAEKPRSIPKEKNRRKQMMKDIALFQQVVEHPIFHENASLAIKDHLKIKLQTDRQT